MMTVPSRRRLRTRRPPVVVAVLTLGYLLILPAIEDASPGELWGIWLPLGVFYVVVVVRAFLVGVRVTPKGLVVDQWFWQTTLPRERVQAVRTRGYSGWLNGHGYTTRCSMLVVLLPDGEEREFPAVAGSRARMERLAAELAAGLRDLA